MVQRITVVAHPQSRKPRLEVRAGVVHVFVTERPVDGKATEAIRLRVAEYMGVRPSRVRLWKGESSRVKIFVCE